jgi:preprotein translocase subunit SecG
MYTTLLVILLLDAVILTTAVLFQAGQGGGLASLGGGAGTETFMGGRQAVTLLTKVTWWCAGIFLFLALVLAVMQSHAGAARSVIQQNLPEQQQQAPTQSAPLPLQTSPAPTKPSTPNR